MTTRKTNFDTGKIRSVLLEKFTLDELKELCLDVTWLKPLYNRFDSAQDKSPFVDGIIDYCDKNDRYTDLLNEIQSRRASTPLISEFMYGATPVTQSADQSRLVKDWSYVETPRLATDEVIQILHAEQNYQALAVDNGLMLYISPHFRPIDLSALPIHRHRDFGEVEMLKDPTPLQLSTKIFEADIEDGPIYDYLRQLIRSKDWIDVYQTKVGFYQARLPPSSFPDLPMNLDIVPLNFWIVDNFNRRILLNPDDRLLEIREQVLHRAIKGGDRSVLPACPSALYAEVSIISSDNKLVLLEKNRNASALAKSRNRRWTCSVEEGFTWGNFTPEGGVDFLRVIKRCLRRELHLDDASVIESVNVYGLALECTHLNTALVGVLRLGISSMELVSGIRNSEDYGLQWHFIDMEEVFEKLFAHPIIRPDEWHPTGRLRALLALYEYFGYDEIRQKMNSLPLSPDR